MGFFQRLAKSFRTQPEPDVEAPAESDHTSSSSLLRSVVPANIVPAEPEVTRSADSSHNTGSAPLPQPVVPAVIITTEPEVAMPAESVALTCAPRFPEPVIAAVVRVEPNSHAQFETSSPTRAVAVAEMPEESFEAQVAFNDKPSDVALFDADFEQDLDDAFASLISQGPSTEAQTVNQEMFAADQSSVEDLFADIAANHARPVKNFIFELRRGTATRDWVEICIPAMHGITRAAEGMGLTVAAQRMVDFRAALSLGQNSKDRVLSGEVRDLLLQRYEDLTEVMPKAFVVAEEERLREGIIINSLLRQIPGVGRVTVGKIYRAGLTSIDTLQMAKTDELAVATGIPTRLSERICEKFQAYRARAENNHRDPADLGQRARLTKMLAELTSYHKNFQHASKNVWSNPALASDKRNYRQQRQSSLLWINVLLAEEGEVELVNQLKKLSFDRRIRRLEEYLDPPPATL